MSEPVPAPPAGARTRTTGLLLMLLLALSAWIQLTVVTRTVIDAPLRSDAIQYFSYAWNLDRHGIYSVEPTWWHPDNKAVPDAMRTPGYPIFLLLAGHPQPSESWLHRVALMQALLGVGSVLLAWLLARRWLGPGLSLLAALVIAINPWLAMTSAYLLSESLFTFLLLASLLLSVRAGAQGAHAWRALLAGACWGACALVRPAVEFLPPLFLGLALCLPALARFRRPAALALLAFALAWAPWLLRNRLVDVVDESGPGLLVTSLAHGSYPGFMFDQRPESFAYPYRFDPEYARISRDLPSVLGHIAGEFRNEPLRYAYWYLLGKPYYFLSIENVQSEDVGIYPVLRSPYYEDLRMAVMRLASYRLHWPLTLLGLAAMLMLSLRPGWLRLTPPQHFAAALTALVLVYAIAVHMAVAPFPRYSIPFRPLLFALAMLPLRAAWLALRERAGAGRNLVA